MCNCYDRDETFNVYVDGQEFKLNYESVVELKDQLQYIIDRVESHEESTRATLAAIEEMRRQKYQAVIIHDRLVSKMRQGTK